MTARVPAPDFRHLSVWPATGARYGAGRLVPLEPVVSGSERAETSQDASPATQG